jgi:hypothetical protein
MEFRQTAEWWNAQSPVEGKAHRELYPHELAGVRGGQRKTWGNRRGVGVELHYV